jgi:hypothetical protein
MHSVVGLAGRLRGSLPRASGLEWFWVCLGARTQLQRSLSARLPKRREGTNHELVKMFAREGSERCQSFSQPARSFPQRRKI